MPAAKKNPPRVGGLLSRRRPFGRPPSIGLAGLRATPGAAAGTDAGVLDAQRELIVDLVLCEDGHAQERSMLPELLVSGCARKWSSSPTATSSPASSSFGLAARRAYFVIRQHASTLTWNLRGKRRRIGRIATGMVYEQGMGLHFQGKTLFGATGDAVLDNPTESGDTEIHIVTNLTAEQATAQQVAVTYGTRWTVEGAFRRRTCSAARWRPWVIPVRRCSRSRWPCSSTTRTPWRRRRCGARGRNDRGRAVGLPIDERRCGDVRGDGHRGPGTSVGRRTVDVGGPFAKAMSSWLTV